MLAAGLKGLDGEVVFINGGLHLLLPRAFVVPPFKALVGTRYVLGGRAAFRAGLEAGWLKGRVVGSVAVT